MSQNSRIFLSGKRLTRFEALQRCLVPRSQKFSAEQRKNSVALVNGILGDKPFLIHFKIALFFILIDLIALTSGLRTFRNLSATRQDKVMNWVFDSPLALFRKGFWGVNTLAKMGVYGQKSVYEDIGYKLRETPR